MATITELAENLIADSRHIFSYKDVLESLEDETVFNSVSTQLKRSMVSFKLADTVDEPLELFEERLTAALCELKTNKPGSVSKYVKEWFEEDADINHQWAIKICFALEQHLLKIDPDFDPEERIKMVTEFLRKATGIYSFNFRSAEDSTYFFCLLHGKPYSVAQNILEQYRERSKDILAKSTGKEAQVGDTRVLSTSVQGLAWESKERFLNLYLLPNAPLFIGYPLSAIEEYRRRMTLLRRVVLLDLLKEEQHLLPETIDNIREKAKLLKLENNNLNNFADDCRNDDSTRLRIHTTVTMISFLKENGPDELYQKLCHIKTDYRSIGKVKDDSTAVLMKEEATNILKVYKALEAEREKDPDRLFELLEDLVPDDVLFREAFSHSRDERIVLREDRQAYADQLKSISDSFPRAQYLSKIQAKPEKTIHTLITRKLILLLLFLEYTYSWSSDREDGDITLLEFKALAEEALANCGLAPLYPGNRFDWLLLKIVKLYEDYDAMKKEAGSTSENGEIDLSGLAEINCEALYGMSVAEFQGEVKEKVRKILLRQEEINFVSDFDFTKIKGSDRLDFSHSRNCLLEFSYTVAHELYGSVRCHTGLSFYLSDSNMNSPKSYFHELMSQIID